VEKGGEQDGEAEREERGRGGGEGILK